jgi:hypothetical protein
MAPALLRSTPRAGTAAMLNDSGCCDSAATGARLLAGAVRDGRGQTDPPGVTDFFRA